MEKFIEEEKIENDEEGQRVSIPLNQDIHS